MEEIFIGRQPIFDRDLHVYGYELLYRGGEANTAGIVDSERATSQVIVNAFLEFGLDRLVGTSRAFINITPGLLHGDDPLPFDKDHLGLELHEDIALDEQLMAAVLSLHSQGYSIVLDNFRYHDKLVPLVKLADMVKIDVRVVDDSTVQEYVNHLRPHRVKLAATKVETHDELATYMKMGFDYFQGYFLAKPRVMKQHGVPASRLAVLRLLGALQNPDVDIQDIDELIAQDLSLSYKLLRYINSAAFSLPKKVDSIRRAVTYLGIQPIKRWVRLVAMSGVADQPMELLLTALNRAKMSELLGKAANKSDTDSYFTVGLFSALDALLDMPMREVLAQLPLASELTEALLTHEGELGRALSCVLAHERGRWEEVDFAELPTQTINEAFVQAIEWSRETGRELLEG